jgi:hypothetical protein
MASKFQPRSEGVTVTSDLPPTLHILLKKTLPKNNIVVGDDRAQIRFLEQQLSTEAKKIEAVQVDRVTDDMLAGYEGKLYQVSLKHKVDLSPETPIAHRHLGSRPNRERFRRNQRAGEVHRDPHPRQGEDAQARDRGSHWRRHHQQGRSEYLALSCLLRHKRSRMLRHSNVRTTLGIYSDAVDANKVAAQGQYLNTLLSSETVQ